MLRMSSQPQRFQASQQRKPCIYFSRTSLAPSPDSSPPLGQNHFPSDQHHHHYPQHARAHSHQDYNSRLPPHRPRDLWSFLTREHSPPSCARSTTFSPGIRLNFVLFYISSSDSCARVSGQLAQVKNGNRRQQRCIRKVLRMHSSPARLLWVALTASGGTAPHLNAHLSPLLCQVGTIVIMWLLFCSWWWLQIIIWVTQLMLSPLWILHHCHYIFSCWPPRSNRATDILLLLPDVLLLCPPLLGAHLHHRAVSWCD